MIIFPVPMYVHAYMYYVNKLKLKGKIETERELEFSLKLNTYRGQAEVSLANVLVVGAPRSVEEEEVDGVDEELEEGLVVVLVELEGEAVGEAEGQREAVAALVQVGEQVAVHVVDGEAQLDGERPEVARVLRRVAGQLPRHVVVGLGHLLFARCLLGCFGAWRLWWGVGKKRIYIK